MKITIDMRRQRPILDKREKLVYVMEIDFFADDFGPFTIRIPIDEYSKEREMTEIRKIADEMRELGSEFEI